MKRRHTYALVKYLNPPPTIAMPKPHLFTGDKNLDEIAKMQLRIPERINYLEGLILIYFEVTGNRTL